MSLWSLGLIVSLTKNWILSWKYFSFRILKVQLHHLISSVAVQRDVQVLLIRNSAYVTFFPWKLEAYRSFSLSPVFWNITAIYLGVGLFSSNVLSIWWVISVWQLMCFSSGKLFWIIQWWFFFPCYFRYSFFLSRPLDWFPNALILILHFCIFLLYLLGDSLNFILESFH